MRRGAEFVAAAQTGFAAIPQRFHIGVTILPYIFAFISGGVLGAPNRKLMANRGDY